MDLRRLRLFVAVVEHGGFTAAAKAAFVAQPAVSLAVKELEAELGAELVVRSREGARLTAAGEALYEPARQILRDVEVAAAAVAAVTGLVAGRLDVAVLATLAADAVAPVVGAFRAAHPAVAVDVASPAEPADLARAVRTGAAEIGVTEQGLANEGLAEQPLGAQEIVVVGAGRGRALRWADLAARPLVLTPRGTGLRERVEAAAVAAGVELPAPAVETEVRDSLVPLALAGAGVAVVPRSLARDVDARHLDPPLERPVVLVHREAGLSPAAQRFVELATSRRPPRTSAT
jgi:DNA-binding transcriptional LysR family regulator